MQLEIKQVAADLQRTYVENAAQHQSLKILLYGESGTGKTTFLQTCPKPLLVHSFDQGGTKVLTVDGVNIIVDTKFEAETAKAPRAWNAWEAEYARLKAGGIFSQVGTYAIDSLTTASDALMDAILQKGGRTAQTPQLQDYMILGNTLRDMLKDLAELPCNVVVTAHVEFEKDEGTGRMFSSLLITGKMKTKLPLIFDELWVTHAKGTSKGIEYTVQTANDGLFKAKTRMKNLAIFEVPDFSKITEKGKAK